MLYRRKSAISPTNFWTRFYSVVQPFLGGLPTLMPTFSAAFWNLAGEWAIFLRKNRINPAIFRMFSISSQLISRWLRGFFDFSDSFQFVFRFSILYLLIIMRRISTMSIIIGIDHGYYAIKTAHCSFPARLTSYGEHEPCGCLSFTIFLCLIADLSDK